MNYYFDTSRKQQHNCIITTVTLKLFVMNTTIYDNTYCHDNGNNH